MEDLQQNENCHFLCSTIMPDHVHLLFVLGEKLKVGQIIGKMKTLSGRTACQKTGEQLDWQRNFFEHRLHPDELTHLYARYIFMNPYRKGLIPRQVQWPHWACSVEVQEELELHLDEKGCPPDEWFALPDDAPLTIIGKWHGSGICRGAARRRPARPPDVGAPLDGVPDEKAREMLDGTPTSGAPTKPDGTPTSGAPTGGARALE